MTNKEINPEDEEIFIKELTYTNDEELEEEGTDVLDQKVPSIDSEILNRCKIIKDGFGIYRNNENDRDFKVIHRYTLENKNKISVQVITYGATIISIKTPDKFGNFDDIVMGFDQFQGYTNEKNPYFGATVGRISGVIPKCIFSVAGEEYFVSNNFLGRHHANGGFFGFDKVVWNANISEGKLCLSYLSKDLEEGFPGDVVVTRVYNLTVNNELVIETSAHCSKPTPIDISTHVDWNLSSNVGGPKELYKHYLQVNAYQYAQVNKQRMITGKLRSVGQTVFDLRIPRPLGKILHRVPGGGYDHYMNLIRGPEKQSVTLAAKLIHPDNGRFVEVMTNQPGIFVYTQNNLFDLPYIIEHHPISCWCRDAFTIMESKKIQNPSKRKRLSKEKKNLCSQIADSNGHVYGKHGVSYRRHGGIRLVPANYPEPVSRFYEFNTFLLNPGETYSNTTIFKFGNTFEKQYDPLNECNLQGIVF